MTGDAWYYSMKSKMEKLPHLAGVGARERKLFHGTPDEATVRCICYQNFDPRMHGRHGTVYGKGVYFSSTAEYSHRYTKPCPEKNGRRFMFFARVLVGKSARGMPELQRPPPVDPARPHGSLYDSCVNSTSNPTIIVIFDNDQCYPEFLIEYESWEKEQTCTMGTVSGSTTLGSGMSVTRPQGSVTAAATSASAYPVTRAPVIISQSSTPVSVAPAATPLARPTSLPGSQTATYSVSTGSVTSPTKATRAAVPSSSRSSEKGCVMM